MKRFTYLVITAASLVLAAGAFAAEGGTRPDDRATHGQGAVDLLTTNSSIRPDDRAMHGPGAFGGSSDPVRPDDRSWRGVGPVPAIVPVETQAVRGDGFDWVDAGIGAVAAFGLGLLLMGVSTLVLRRQHAEALS